MFEVKIKPERSIKELSRYLKTRPDKVRAAATTAMRRALPQVQAHVIQHHLSGPADHDTLGVRSGNLRRSVAIDITVDSKGEVVGAIGYERGLASRYAAVHEASSPVTIKPRKAKALAIPLDAAKLPSGLPRYPGGPSTVDDLTLIPREGKPPLLVLEKTDGAIVPMFVLVKSVTITPRRPLQRGAKAMQPMVARELTKSIKQALEDV